MKPTHQEINDSIEELKNYKDRLRSEIIHISKKLRLSQAKIEITLEENSELKNLEATIKKLTEQRDKNYN